MFSFLSHFLWRNNKIEPEKNTKITQISYLITNGTTYTRVPPSKPMESTKPTTKTQTKSILASRTMSDSNSNKSKRKSSIPSESLPLSEEIKQDGPSSMVEQINVGVSYGRKRLGTIKRILSPIEEDDGSGKEGVEGEGKVMSICPSSASLEDKKTFFSLRSPTAILPSRRSHTLSNDHHVQRRRVTHLFPGILLSSTMAPRRKTAL